ncbi:hypothetical protein AB4Y44_01940, partial [Paraburkholderia sp. BR10937]|uniref:hypothetical protein n=1 Tax=Paraburkholderia sp. BR10937 TaxID=3236994 RepID=UPI0034D369D2
SLGKRRSSCFKSRTTNLLADSAADTPNVKKDRRSENVLCRPSLGVSTIALWLSHADTARIVLRLTRETYDHFSSFSGLLTSVGTAVRLIQIFALLLAIVAVFQLIKLFSQQVLGTFVRHLTFSVPIACELGEFWRRLRTGRKIADDPDTVHHRQSVALLAPIGTLLWASAVLSFQFAILNASVASSVLTRILVSMEYTQDAACPGATSTGLFARVGDGRVSEAFQTDGGFKFRTMECKSNSSGGLHFS